MIKRLPFNLVILGPQGSGKGTQVRFLAQKFNMPYFSAGELIRSKMREPTKEGKMIKDIYNNGSLIPHEVTKKLFKNALSKVPQDCPVIFEGYPRAKEQYFHFLDILKERKVKDFRVIGLSIKEKTAYKRISGRRYCVGCEKNYYPPQSLTLKECISCGGKIVRRSDDTKNAILKRLNTYKEETQKVISIFKKDKKMIEINGEPPIDIVKKEILRKLDDKIN